jgi:transposase
MDTEAPPQELAPTTNRRRRYSRAFKHQVLDECNEPGASVAGVAIRHGLNPNLVQKWRKALQSTSKSDFVRLPAPTAAPAVAASATLRIEVPTPKGTLIVHWPVSELQQSVAWLRALTR